MPTRACLSEMQSGSRHSKHTATFSALRTATIASRRVSCVVWALTGTAAAGQRDAALCRLQAQAGRAVRALRLDALLTIVMHLDSLVSKGRWQGEASIGTCSGVLQTQTSCVLTSARMASVQVHQHSLQRACKRVVHAHQQSCGVSASTAAAAWLVTSCQLVRQHLVWACCARQPAPMHYSCFCASPLLQ